MTSKVFETLFRINAKYTGGRAFAAANQDLSRTQRHAKTVSAGIGRTLGQAAVALGAVTAAYKALAKAQEFWAKGVEASKEARDVQEKLGVAAEQNAKRFGESGQTIVDSVNKTSDAIAALGFDTEDVQVGVTGLLKSMGSTRQLQSFSQAFANITAKTKGATPGMEGFAETAENVNQAILRGRSPLFAQLGWTDKQIKAFKKLSQAERLLAIQQHGMNQLAGEAVRVMDTTAGKVGKAAKAQEDLAQALTAGAVAQEGKLAVIYERIYIKLQPTAERIGLLLAKHFENFANWLDAHSPEIANWIDYIAEHLDRMKYVFWPIEYTIQLGEKFRDTLKAIGFDGEKLPGIFEQVWRNVQEGSSKAFQGIQTMWSGLAGFFSGVVEAVRKALEPIYGAIIGPFKRAFDWIIQNDPAKGYIPPTTGEGVGGGGMSSEFQKFESSQKAGAIPTTKYSKGGRFGPDEMQDKWTNRGYTSSGPNLSPGVVAVNTSRYPLGTVFQDQNTGKVYVAADRHGNVNKNVVDVFRSAATYGSGQKENLKVIGNMGKVPSTREGLQEALSKYGSPPSASLRGATRGLGTPASGGATNNISMSSPITVNGVAPGREQLVARQVRTAVRDPMRQLLDQIKAARNYESRLGYV